MGTNSSARTLKKFRLGLQIIATLAFFIAPPVTAAEEQFNILPYCFRADECVSGLYKGIPAGCSTQAEYRSNNACALRTAECDSQAPAAITRGYVNNCYAPPPKVKLQISILGQEVQGLENYLSNLYRYLVGIVGIVAGIMIVWAGVKWLTSGGNPERISDAKKKIGNASIGLVLVLGAYVLLQTLNPALVALQPPAVKMARRFTEVKELKCKNIPEFPCGGTSTEPAYSVQGNPPPPGRALELRSQPDGLYTCDSPGYTQYNPCEDSPAPECIGIYCDFGGCFDLVPERLTELAGLTLLARYGTPYSGPNGLISPPRGCFTRSECANCNLPIEAELSGQVRTLTPQGKRNARLCISSACECLLITKKNDNDEDIPYCTKRKKLNEPCDDYLECESGLICTPSAQGAKCLQPNSHKDGEACVKDTHCLSGICRGLFCTGSTQGSTCGPGGRCATHLGFRCTDTWGGNECYDGRPGSSCRTSSHCQPGKRCNGGGTVQVGTCE